LIDDYFFFPVGIAREVVLLWVKNHLFHILFIYNKYTIISILRDAVIVIKQFITP